MSDIAGPGECLAEECDETAAFRCVIESMNARGYQTVVVACPAHIAGAAHVAAERLKAIEEENPVEDVPANPFVAATEKLRQEEEARAAAAHHTAALVARAQEAARAAAGAAARPVPGGFLLVGGGEETGRAGSDPALASPLVAGTVGMILGLLIGGRR